nr:MAG TPA: hypothetical protein [Bacteriophage sp.]
MSVKFSCKIQLLQKRPEINLIAYLLVFRFQSHSLPNHIFFNHICVCLNNPSINFYDNIYVIHVLILAKIITPHNASCIIAIKLYFIFLFEP